MKAKNFFKTEAYGFKLWWLFIPVGIGLIGLMVGGFLDLDISRAFVDQNDWMAKFWEGPGLMLTFSFTMVGAGFLAAGLWQLKHIAWKIIGLVLLAGSAALFSYLGTGHMVDKYAFGLDFAAVFGSSVDVWMAIFVILFQSSIGLVTFLICKSKDSEKLIRIGLIIMLCTGVEAGILELFKRACYRPRFRWLAGYTFDAEGNFVLAPEARIYLFRAWFEDWQWFSKAYYQDASDPIRYAVESDAIKSFPSGHTGNATLFMTLPLIVAGFGLTEKKKILVPCLFGIGLALTLTMAIYRVRAGAHFVSDVSFSLIIVDALYIFVFFLCMEAKKKEVQPQ